MDITFIISHFPDPRMNKRIQIAKEVGQTSLIFWDRGTVDIWSLVHTDIKNVNIKVVADYTNPLKRIFPTLKFAFQAFKKLAELKPKSIYVSNIDMLMIAALYSYFKKNKPQILYEIADLNHLIADEHKSFIKNSIKKSIISLEKKLCKSVDTLVITSEKFYDVYYSKFLHESKTFFLPNMPNLNVFNNYTRKETGQFTVGFIGAVRYKKQMKMLINAAENNNVKVLFAGAGLDKEIEDISKNKSYVSYHGRYNYDQEIASLYGQVDCVFAVYDADLNNVRIALPNKLYESIYCELPIIVAKNTYLAELVERMGVGVAVSHTDEEEFAAVLKRLSTDSEFYNSLVESCKKHKCTVNLDHYNQKLKDKFLESLEH